MSRRAERRGAPLLDELAEETPQLLARLDAPAPADAEIPQLPLSDIAPDPAQPRRHLRQETLEALAADIARAGVLQPLVVRPAPDWNGYVLVFGERRYRAALLAGLTHVPALVRRDLSEADVLDLQWQENAQREDIDDIDKALHLKRLKEVHSLSWSQLADRVHLSRRHLLRMQQLAEMPETVTELVRERRIAPSHVYQLARLSDAGRQAELARAAAEGGWSVQRLSRAIAPAEDEGGNAPEAHPWQAFVDALRERLAGGSPLKGAEREILRQIQDLTAALQGENEQAEGARQGAERGPRKGR